jgi:carboxyl-terminal processing protease
MSREDTCLAAALETVDPRAIYIPPQQTTERRENAQKAPVGIGLEVGAVHQPGDDLLIVSALSGGPGERAGVRGGDLLVRIDGQDVRPMTAHQAMMRLRGEPGSEVSLELARGADHERVSMVVHRARIRVKAVRREPGQGAVAALRIGRFDDGTPGELGNCVNELLSAVDPPPTALLVDLRADPGGALDIVLQVASLFSERPDAVVGRVADGAGSRSLTAAAAQVDGLSPAARAWLSHVRLGILVDHGTGSGAELLAQFLRESRNARVLGSRTFGMAYVAEMMPLKSGASMLLPAGELTSPRGLSWEARGITPDAEVAATPRAEFGSRQDGAFYSALQDLLSQ